MNASRCQTLWCLLTVGAIILSVRHYYSINDTVHLVASYKKSQINHTITKTPHIIFEEDITFSAIDNTSTTQLSWEEFMKYSTHFSAKVSALARRAKEENLTEFKGIGGRLAYSGIDPDFLKDLGKNKNCLIAVFTIPSNVFYRVLYKKVFPPHSNNCKAKRRGLPVDHNNMYGLKCTETESYNPLYLSKPNFQYAKAYDYQTGQFREVSNVHDKQPHGHLTNGDVNISYLLLVKNAYVNGYGDFEAEDISVQILRCKLTKRATSTLNAEVPVFDQVFSISQFWGAARFHFPIEDLPRIVLSIDYLRRNPDIKIHVSVANDFTQTFLNEVGISAERLVHGTVKAKILYVPPGTACGTASLAHINLLSISLRDKLRPQPKQDTIVLIKRSSKHRQFRNHNSILSMLQEAASKYNLQVFVFEDKPLPSFNTIKQMFNRAIMVVGPHGAGLSNLIFSQPETCVVEGLCAEYNFCYTHLAQVLGHIYHGIIPKGHCTGTTPEELKPHVHSCLRYHF